MGRFSLAEPIRWDYSLNGEALSLLILALQMKPWRATRSRSSEIGSGAGFLAAQASVVLCQIPGLVTTKHSCFAKFKFEQPQSTRLLRRWLDESLTTKQGEDDKNVPTY